MSNFVCKKCGSSEYEIKDKPNGTGIAHGLYCAKCGFWNKWLNKDELKKLTTIKPQEKCYSIDEVNYLIAETDKLIQRLKSENSELTAKNKVLQRNIENLTWREKASMEFERLESENAELRDHISQMIMPPCTLGDTLYVVSFCFGDGYDEAGNAIHTSGWKITKTKVDEKNFYRMCDLVRNEKAFFSRAAAESRLAELKGE